MKSILASYWLEESPILNYGEALVPYLLRHFGYRCLPDTRLYAKFPNPRLLSITSELNSDYLRSLRNTGKSIVVWGGGHSHGNPIERDQADIRAVRGHLTRNELGLGEDFPVGDPGFLVSTVFPFKTNPTGPALWIPHIHNRGIVPASDWGAEFDDVGLHMIDVERFLKRLTKASFIFTSSMHIAIAAIAYHLPFALCVGPGENIDKPRKWEDLWSTLRCEGGQLAKRPVQWCATPQEAKQWYADSGHALYPPDLTAIVKAFPHEIAFDAGRLP